MASVQVYQISLVVLATSRRLRSVTQIQKMADLREDRVEPSAPFTDCEVRYFCPWFIRKGRKELKRLSVKLTCLCCRAGHSEIAVALTIDSFFECIATIPYYTLSCKRTGAIGVQTSLMQNANLWKLWLKWMTTISDDSF